MLKAVPHSRSLVNLREIAPKISVFALRMLLGALMCRARLVGELAPFAPALTASALMSGWQPLPLIAGAALGCLPDGLNALTLAPLASCLITYAQYLILTLIGRMRQHDFGARDFLTGCIAGVGTLLPGLLLSGGQGYNVLTACLAATVSMLLAPAMTSALNVAPWRRLLMPDEQLSLALMALLSLISLRSVPWVGTALSTGAAVLLTLAGAALGPGMGALAGIAAGTALTLGGSDPFIGSSLCLGGLLAGCVRRMPRPCACLALACGNFLTVSWGLGYTIGAVAWGPLAAGAAIYCLLPGSMLVRLHSWMTPVHPQADPERLAQRMRRGTAQRLEEISEVFGELADGYADVTCLPNEPQLIEAMRSRLCEGCEGYTACWQGDQAQAGRLLCRLATETAAGQVTPASQLPPDLLRHCRRSAQIDRRLTPWLCELSGARQQELRRGEAKNLISRQFQETSQLLSSLSTQLRGPILLDGDYARMARAALERARLPVSDLMAVVDSRLEITCVMAQGVWSADSARLAAALLSDELGIPLSPVLSKGRVPGEVELRLIQAPALTAETAVISRACQAGFACGDSALCRLTPDGRLIAAISDGMGHGEEASAESRRCLSLLRKFVSAGIDREAALAAINRLLLMRSGEDMFATADLCVVNLHSGQALFSKLGGCSSYILQEKGVAHIAGGRLPLGIIEEIAPAVQPIEVHPGDLIVMISDGVADDLRAEQAEWLKTLLPRIRHLKPQAAAEFLIDQAIARDGGLPQDDMTVLAVRILARRVRSYAS